MGVSFARLCDVRSTRYARYGDRRGERPRDVRACPPKASDQYYVIAYGSCTADRKRISMRSAVD